MGAKCGERLAGACRLYMPACGQRPCRPVFINHHLSAERQPLISADDAQESGRGQWVTDSPLGTVSQQGLALAQHTGWSFSDQAVRKSVVACLADEHQ